jgi:hypothetical protein
MLVISLIVDGAAVAGRAAMVDCDASSLQFVWAGVGGYMGLRRSQTAVALILSERRTVHVPTMPIDHTHRPHPGKEARRYRIDELHALSESEEFLQ